MFFFVVTLIIDPGYIKRSRNPELLASYTGAITCDICMVTNKDHQVKKNISHCKLCGRCCEKHDHHCGVLGTCIGKNNIVPFYIMVAAFGLQMALCYIGLYSSFSATTEMCDANKNLPRDFGVDYILNLTKNVSLTGVKDIIMNAHTSGATGSGT